MIDRYELKSQVKEWGVEAQSIHGITKSQMLTYTDKPTALDAFGDWLSSVGSFEVIVFANPNVMGKFYHYDVAVIQFELMNHYQVDRIEDQPFKPQKITSVYTMARDSYRAGRFLPNKSDKNRYSFSQVNVYAALFNKSYNAHDAVADVEAMKEIYFELINREETGIIDRNQLSLL